MRHMQEFLTMASKPGMVWEKAHHCSETRSPGHLPSVSGTPAGQRDSCCAVVQWHRARTLEHLLFCDKDMAGKVLNFIGFLDTATLTTRRSDALPCVIVVLPVSIARQGVKNLFQ